MCGARANARDSGTGISFCQIDQELSLIRLDQLSTPHRIFSNYSLPPKVQLPNRPFTMFTRTLPASRSLRAVSISRTIRHSNISRVAPFSTSPSYSATPAGPPPPGFRLPRKETWQESKESSLDKAGKYFLMTEMMRGMYVVLEQFFRPP